MNEQNCFVGWVAERKFEPKEVIDQAQNFFQHSDQKPNSPILATIQRLFAKANENLKYAAKFGSYGDFAWVNLLNAVT